MISESCKIIIPSSHVVYEGLNEVKRDIKEYEPTSNISYKSKITMKNNLKTFKFAGSVYGYSTDTSRIGYGEFF